MEYYWVYWKVGSHRIAVKDLKSDASGGSFEITEVTQNDLWPKEKAYEIMEEIKSKYPTEEFEVELRGQTPYPVK